MRFLFKMFSSQPETPWEIGSEKICKRSLPGCWSSMFVLLFSFPHRTSVQKPFQHYDVASWAWEVVHVLKGMLEIQEFEREIRLCQRTLHYIVIWLFFSGVVNFTKIRQHHKIQPAFDGIVFKCNLIIHLQFYGKNCPSASLEPYSLPARVQWTANFYSSLSWITTRMGKRLRMECCVFNMRNLIDRQLRNVDTSHTLPYDGFLMEIYAVPPHLKILSVIRFQSTWHTSFGFVPSETCRLPLQFCSCFFGVFRQDDGWWQKHF